MMSWIRREVLCPWFASRHGKPYRGLVAGIRQELDRAANPAKREHMQFARAKEIINHAFRHSSFYRRHFQAAGFDPARFMSLEDMKNVPVFEKAHIIGHQEEIRASDVGQLDLIPTATGGTTGNSFQFWYDRNCYRRREALTVLANAAYGWHPGDPAAIVWNAHQDIPAGRLSLKARLRNWLGWRYLVLDATYIDEARLASWTEQMHRHRTEVIYGYAASIREIATYLEATGRRIPSVRLVITTAEPLYPADRALVQRTFECPVRDRYASRENGPMAQEDDGGRLRYFSNSMLLEIESGEGEVGDILVTDFWNRAFPFIRYRIGDVAVVDSLGTEAAGLPVLGSLAGRQTDFLLARDGSRVSGMTFHEAYMDEQTHACGVDSFFELQFRQTAADVMVVRIVPGPTFQKEEDEARLTSLVRKILGADMQLDYEYPEAIGRSASGKYRFTINEIES